jgi:hypothetical protein
MARVKKIFAIRQARKALGQNATARDIVAYVKEYYDFTVSVGLVYYTKSRDMANQTQKGKLMGQSPTPMQVATGGTPALVRQMKDLLGVCEAQTLHELIEAVR